MSWREAWNLTGILVKDSSSQVGAALAGWSAPRTTEWLLLADLYDLQHASKAKRAPKPYPRPTDKPNTRKVGKTSLPRAEAIRLLSRVSPTRSVGPARDARGRFTKPTPAA